MQCPTSLPVHRESLRKLRRLLAATTAIALTGWLAPLADAQVPPLPAPVAQAVAPVTNAAKPVTETTKPVTTAVG